MSHLTRDLLEAYHITAYKFIDERGYFRQRFWIKEKKRGKRQAVVFKESIREAQKEYLAAYPDIGEEQGYFITISTL
jgi:hypothetical protein